MISLHNFRMIENFKSNFTINLVCHIPPLTCLSLFFPTCFQNFTILKYMLSPKKSSAMLFLRNNNVLSRVDYYKK